ncbi:MAG: isoleucine--tRNA ligase [Zestosphaera sp.]
MSSIDLGRMRLSEVEKEAKRFWESHSIPSKWRSWSDGRPVFSFLEGPPTANGVPHIGHLRGRIYKDFVLKLMRLRGYNVWAQGGWDEQGLPVEVETEKKLGIKHKKEIGTRISMEDFIRKCNELVDYYLRFWESYATRDIALWLDLENAYETREPHYVEYVWRLVKKAYQEGLLYEGFRVLPFCPRCETVLSDAEVDLGYEERTSPSIIVKFKVAGAGNTYLLIWTTTPWTLIDNEAVAANPDGVYCKLRVGNEYWWVAESRVDEVATLTGLRGECVEKVVGRGLAGLEYEHPLVDEVPIHRAHSNAHKVLTGEFVSLNEGTGLVHIAPGHGPEDFELGSRNGLPITSSVGINGVFNEDGGVFSDLHVDDASKKVVEVLKSKGLLLHSGTIRHAYPHCWRCHNPLIYRADRQWFIKITDMRERLMNELEKVNMYPPKLKDRFTNWVANAKDWTLSRSRIWGTPLPIWRCRDDLNKVLVVGSLSELRGLAVDAEGLNDFELVHRPWIDRVQIRTEECGEWVREPFVVDVWIDSGVAWGAGVDGFRNAELFSKLFPYDFITEGVDQTRGWFYSLLVTSVILTGRAPYKNILIQGLILDKYGRKMSKHLGNVVYAEEALRKHGADVLRLYILSTYPPGDPFIYNEDEIRNVLTSMNIIWNVFRFAHTYMSLDKFNPETHKVEELISNARPEDLWILSRVNTVMKNYLSELSSYNIHLAVRDVIDFFVEDLSHRYLRLIRRRVWEEESVDRFTAYSVLYYVLRRALKMLAPATPHLAEVLWQRFFRYYDAALEESVHLSVLEGVDEKFIRPDLEEGFDKVFEVFSAAAALRNNLELKLRWPVRVVYISAESATLRRLSGLEESLKFLSNAKEVVLTDQLPSECNESDTYSTLKTDSFLVCMPRKLDKDLLNEALSREVIRRVQVMRNRANLVVDEFIDVGIETEEPELKEALNAMKDYIAREVRARNIFETISSDMSVTEWDIEGMKIRIGIRKCVM